MSDDWLSVLVGLMICCGGLAKSFFRPSKRWWIAWEWVDHRVQWSVSPPTKCNAGLEPIQWLPLSDSSTAHVPAFFWNSIKPIIRPHPLMSLDRFSVTWPTRPVNRVLISDANFVFFCGDFKFLSWPSDLAHFQLPNVLIWWTLDDWLIFGEILKWFSPLAVK